MTPRVFLCVDWARKRVRRYLGVNIAAGVNVARMTTQAEIVNPTIELRTALERFRLTRQVQ